VGVPPHPGSVADKGSGARSVERSSHGSPIRRFIDAFSHSGPVRIRYAPAGSILFREGESPRFVGLITDGQVQLCRQVAGREVILSLLGPGDTVGDVPVLAGSPSSWDAVVNHDTTILVIEATELRYRLWHDPQLAHHWVDAAARQAQALYERQTELLAGDLDVRIAALLVHLSHGSNCVNITQHTLAGLLGTGRTYVNRTLRHMQAQRLLTVHRARLQITDRAGLTALAIQKTA
jgi:CRP-like cAMP-binding protein